MPTLTLHIGGHATAWPATAARTGAHRGAGDGRGVLLGIIYHWGAEDCAYEDDMFRRMG